MNLGKIQIAVLFLILANIIWGASFPIYKLSLENIPPFTFVFLRFYIAALVILPFAIKNIHIDRKDIPTLIMLSLFSISLQIPLLFFGLKLTPSINAPIIIASGPIFLIIASILFLKEKLKIKVLGGTLISLFGVILIMISPLLQSGFSGGIFGNLLIFLAMLCGVVQAILIKKLTKLNSPVAIVFWSFLLGSLPLLPFVFWESQKFNIWTDLNAQGLLGLIYGIVFASVIAHYFYTYGLKYIKASEVGVYAYVDPLATVIIAIPLLGETLTLIYLIASIFVFLGIFIAEGRIPYHPLHKLFSKS